MLLSVIATTFPLVAVGELPDKTMFASLLLASRGRPLAVWLGAAAAFSVHVVIAVSIGVALFSLLPHRALEVVVGLLFLAGATFSWRARNEDDRAADPADSEVRSARRTTLTAAGVIFLAEWGDLTQIITADLAARWRDPVGVGIGALAALWTVAAVAVVGGAGLMRVLSVRILRIVTAAALLGLAAASLAAAAGG